VVTDQLRGVAQAGAGAVLEGNLQGAVNDGVAVGVNVSAAGQRRGFVEKGAGEGNDLVATDLVVAFTLLGTIGFADGIGAVQRVVQRTPAGVRGVEGKARIHDWYYQLRASHASDFVIDVLRRCLEICGFWLQIPNILEEGFISHGVMGLAGLSLVPGVDPRLQIIAFGEQCFVLGRQVIDDLIGTCPELIGGEAGTGNSFVVYEVEQDFGDLQATDVNVFSHCLPHSFLFKA